VENLTKKVKPILSDEEKLEKRRKYRREYFKNRYHSDPEFRERLIKHIKATRLKRKEHYAEVQKKWRDERGEEHKEYMREWRKNHKEHIKAYRQKVKEIKKEKDLNSS